MITYLLVAAISLILTIISYKYSVTEEKYNKRVDELTDEDIAIFTIATIFAPVLWLIIFVNLLRTVGKYFEDKNMLTKIKEILRSK